MRDGEYADKVLKYLSAVVPVNDQQVRRIGPLVVEYRRQAVPAVRSYLVAQSYSRDLQDRSARFAFTKPYVPAKQ